MKRLNQKAFTLVELLAVVVVIVMVIALTVPGIRGLGGSRRVVNGGNTVVNLVNYTRQIARTENRLAALVLIKETIGSAEGSRLMAVIQQEPDRDSWKQVTAWERLPEGVIIDGEESDLYFNQRVPVQPALPTLKSGTVTYAPASYAYQIFLPNGTMLLTANREPREIYVRAEIDQEKENYFNIIINPNTGVPLIRRP